MADEQGKVDQAEPAAPAIAAPAPKPAKAAAPESKSSPDPSDKEQAVQRGIDAWLNTHIRNSPVSRHSPAWNHLGETLGHLKASILKEL